MTNDAAQRQTSFGLSAATINKINQVLVGFPEVDQAKIYGSRAKGSYRHGSDIDLTLFGAHLDQRQCAEIADQLDDLLLPYKIDLSVFHLLDHADLKEHIERVGKVFYQKEK
jgi:predicted nucleotidyltransferase